MNVEHLSLFFTVGSWYFFITKGYKQNKRTEHLTTVMTNFWIWVSDYCSGYLFVSLILLSWPWLYFHMCVSNVITSALIPSDLICSRSCFFSSTQDKAKTDHLLVCHTSCPKLTHSDHCAAVKFWPPLITHLHLPQS